jgi:FkbM family methyltransferase
MFYSQQGEDVYIYKNFININTPDGVFVEVGGYDGVTYSNSKFFEDTLGFTGVLIEPTAQYYTMCRNRPNCQNYNYAVHSSSEFVKFIGTGAVAGSLDTMSDSFRSKHYPDGDVEYQVRGKPIKDILKLSNLSYVDILSIDVEGGELLVLETYDFSLPTYLIVIELDGHNIVKDEKCRDILSRNGFILKKRIAINEFWENPFYPRKNRLFNSRNMTVYNKIEDIPNYNAIELHLRDEVLDALKYPNS